MRENLMRVYARLPERVRRDIEFQMDSPRHKCLLLELEQVMREMDEFGVGCRDSLQVLKKEAWKMRKGRGVSRTRSAQTARPASPPDS